MQSDKLGSPLWSLEPSRESLLVEEIKCEEFSQ